MKNLIIDNKKMVEIRNRITECLPISTKQELQKLKENLNLEFIYNKQENFQLFWNFILDEIKNKKDGYTFKLKNCENAWDSQQIINEYIYLHYYHENTIIQNWNFIPLQCAIQTFNSENLTNISIRDLIYRTNIDDVLNDYKLDKCNKKVLEKTKEFQKYIDTIFYNLNENDMETYTAALYSYMFTKDFTVLHNYLVTNKLEFQV